MSLSTSDAQRQSTASQRGLNLAQIVGVVSVTLFTTTEIAAASAAGVWGLSGLLHLGTTGEIVLSGIIGLPAIYGVCRCAQLAFEAETDPQNQ
ncbi:hypothetical protein AB2N04_14915 [Nitratireductor sp. GISD-1A_MAKvit]|uniref:hypothetical protein n=1 Tax=Nitratireductor sp. GISD-1A_MAKvit TaxID=3234198 RepID=UPI003465D74D